MGDSAEKARRSVGTLCLVEPGPPRAAFEPHVHVKSEAGSIGADPVVERVGQGPASGTSSETHGRALARECGTGTPPAGATMELDSRYRLPVDMYTDTPSQPRAQTTTRGHGRSLVAAASEDASGAGGRHFMSGSGTDPMGPLGPRPFGSGGTGMRNHGQHELSFASTTTASGSASSRSSSSSFSSSYLHSGPGLLSPTSSPHVKQGVMHATRAKLRIRVGAALFLCGVGALSTLSKRLLQTPTAMWSDWHAPDHTGSSSSYSSRGSAPLAGPLPWPLWYGAQGASALLRQAARSSALRPAAEVVRDDALGGVARTALLHTACVLGLPDAVALDGMPWGRDIGIDSGSSLPEIAAGSGNISVGAAGRLVRALAAMGYLRSSGFNRYVATPPLAALRRSAPEGSLCPFVAHLVELSWGAWRLLPQAVGDASFNAHAAAYGGVDIWSRLDGSPRLTSVMSDAMASIDSLSTEPLVTDFPAWGTFSRIVDVGGSSGSFVRRILVHTGTSGSTGSASPVRHDSRKGPALGTMRSELGALPLSGTGTPARMQTGLVFDRPTVVQKAWHTWAREWSNGSQHGTFQPSSTPTGTRRSPRLSRDGLQQEQLQFTPGSFFQPATIPSGLPGDAFVLRVVLHDFSDGECVTILTNLRHAMLRDDDTVSSPSHQQQQQCHHAAAAESTPSGRQGAPYEEQLPQTCTPPLKESRAAGRVDERSTPRLVLVEQVVEDVRGAPFPIPFRGIEDLHMIVVTRGGRERTLAEWTALLEATGFTIEIVQPTRSLLSMIVALPLPVQVASTVNLACT